MGLDQFSEKQIYEASIKIDAGNGTNHVVIGLPSSGPIRIDAVSATNTDTIPHVLLLWGNDGATNVLLGSVSLPAGQGLAGTPGIDVLAACLPASRQYDLLDVGSQLEASVEVAVTGAFQVGIKTLGGYV